MSEKRKRKIERLVKHINVNTTFSKYISDWIFEVNPTKDRILKFINICIDDTKSTVRESCNELLASDFDWTLFTPRKWKENKMYDYFFLNAIKQTVEENNSYYAMEEEIQGFVIIFLEKDLKQVLWQIQKIETPESKLITLKNRIFRYKILIEERKGNLEIELKLGAA